MPEVGRHTVGYVATEAVNAHLDNPELHGINHGATHVLVVIVQVGHVIPVPRTRMNNGVGLFIMGVPIGMFFHPGMIPCGVVGHPVENDAHLMLVAYLGEILKVVDGSKLRSHGGVVTDAIGRVLALFNANGIDGHDPHHVDAQRADAVNTIGYGT